MNKKLLVFPSWYPKPDNPINGSFFHEQSRVVQGDYDVRVVLIEKHRAPSLSLLLRKPIVFFSKFRQYFSSSLIQQELIEEPVFCDPPFYWYRVGGFAFTQMNKIRKRQSAYLAVVNSFKQNGWNPDLVHAHTADFGGLAAMYVNHRCGVPYVLTEHMPFNLGSFPKFKRRLIKQVFDSAAIVLSISRDKIRQLGMSGIDVPANLVYNLVDEKLFSKVARKYSPGDPIRLISVGAASFLKDQKTLLRAMRRLKQSGKPFHLSLVGLKSWGESYDSILDCIKEFGLQDVVQTYDLVERDAMPTLFQQHSVFILTSIAEGMPVSVLEALCSGLFVVATQHGGTEDVVSPSTGRIVGIKDDQAIALHLESLYLGQIDFDPEQIRQHTIEQYGSTAFKNRIEEYYMQAIESTINK